MTIAQFIVFPSDSNYILKEVHDGLRLIAHHICDFCYVVRWKPQKLDPQKFPANLFTIFYMIFISCYTYKSPKMLIYSVALRLLDSIWYLIYENVVTMNIMLLCS